jgi:hypothetical protein
MNPHRDVANRRDEIREKALTDLQQYEVLMLNGHFDFGNGYHGPVYLNPHQLFRYPSTIWRFAQDLIDVLPASVLDATEVVAGPVTGGALLAHTMAGLLDSRRDQLARNADPAASLAWSAGYGHLWMSNFPARSVASRSDSSPLPAAPASSILEHEFIVPGRGGALNWRIWCDERPSNRWSCSTASRARGVLTVPSARPYG